MLPCLPERDPEGLSGVSCVWIKAAVKEIPSIKSTQEQQGPRESLYFSQARWQRKRGRVVIADLDDPVTRGDLDLNNHPALPSARRSSSAKQIHTADRGRSKER